MASKPPVMVDASHVWDERAAQPMHAPVVNQLPVNRGDAGARIPAGDSQGTLPAHDASGVEMTLGVAFVADHIPELVAGAELDLRQGPHRLDGLHGSDVGRHVMG